VVFASGDVSGAFENDEPQFDRKPHRPTYGGRIKLIPNRKVIRVTSMEQSSMTPWTKNGDGDRSVGSPPTLSSTTKNNSIITSNNKSSPTLWTRIAPFLKRGLLLAALTAVAIVDQGPSSTAVVASAAALSTTGKSSSVVSSWTNLLVPRMSLRLDWSKLWNLPGQILPSLSAALMIAWVPNLIFQKAWFELGFLALSMTSQANLRNYFITEILPSLGGTSRKLFWSEFWKQAWDFLLQPFPHNIFVPPKPSSSQSDDGVWSKWQLEASQFWSDRVVSRIDKWTASSVKALLQKNVQASVDGLAENSLKAFSDAWFPEGKNRELPKQFKLPSPMSSNEDTARMIEIECEHDDGCEDETDENGNEERMLSSAMVADEEAENEIEGENEESPLLSESSVNHCDDEDSSDSSSSSSSTSEPQIEEPQAIRNS
jgi:hypothetical protein